MEMSPGKRPSPPRAPVFQSRTPTMVRTMPMMTRNFPSSCTAVSIRAGKMPSMDFRPHTSSRIDWIPHTQIPILLSFEQLNGAICTGTEVDLPSLAALEIQDWLIQRIAQLNDVGIHQGVLLLRRDRLIAQR